MERVGPSLQCSSASNFFHKWTCVCFIMWMFPLQKQSQYLMLLIYLQGTEAVLDESLDPVELGLLQDLIQFSVVLWKWHWAITQEVQNQSKMPATPVQNNPTCRRQIKEKNPKQKSPISVRTVFMYMINHWSPAGSFSLFNCHLIAFITAWWNIARPWIYRIILRTTWLTSSAM